MRWMTAREVLAHNLKALRAAKGISQEELADLAAIDRTYVSALERCRYSASVDVVQKLASALDVATATLLSKPDQNR